MQGWSSNASALALGTTTPATAAAAIKSSRRRFKRMRPNSFVLRGTREDWLSRRMVAPAARIIGDEAANVRKSPVKTGQDGRSLAELPTGRKRPRRVPRVPAAPLRRGEPVPARPRPGARGPRPDGGGKPALRRHAGLSLQLVQL